MFSVVLKATIDDVHEGSTVASIAQSDRIAALAFSNAQEVDLEIGFHYRSTRSPALRRPVSSPVVEGAPRDRVYGTVDLTR